MAKTYVLVLRHHHRTIRRKKSMNRFRLKCDVDDFRSVLGANTKILKRKDNCLSTLSSNNSMFVHQEEQCEHLRLIFFFHNILPIKHGNRLWIEVRLCLYDWLSTKESMKKNEWQVSLSSLSEGVNKTADEKDPIDTHKRTWTWSQRQSNAYLTIAWIDDIGNVVVQVRWKTSLNGNVQPYGNNGNMRTLDMFSIRRLFSVFFSLSLSFSLYQLPSSSSSLFFSQEKHIHFN